MNPTLLPALGVAFAGLGAWSARSALLRLAPLEERTGPTGWRRRVRWVARAMVPSGSDRDEWLKLMTRAGRIEANALERLSEERALGLLLGCAVGALLASMLPGFIAALAAVLGVLAGMVLPRRRLTSAAEARKEEVVRDLPGAVDLLVTSLEAGLSLEQALQRIGDELITASPVLARELSTAGRECAAGISLAEALRRLGERIDSEDLTMLCTVIAQSHELGAPIASTLGEYNVNLRQLRLAALEENAGTLVIKLTLPLALLLVPSMLLVMVGPAALQLMRSLE